MTRPLQRLLPPPPHLPACHPLALTTRQGMGGGHRAGGAHARPRGDPRRVRHPPRGQRRGVRGDAPRRRGPPPRVAREADRRLVFGPRRPRRIAGADWPASICTASARVDPARAGAVPGMSRDFCHAPPRRRGRASPPAAAAAATAAATHVAVPTVVGRGRRPCAAGCRRPPEHRPTDGERAGVRSGHAPPGGDAAPSVDRRRPPAATLKARARASSIARPRGGKTQNARGAMASGDRW